jgi:competence protein ComEC
MRAPLGIAAAASLVAGTLGCLLLPALPWWPWLALAFACGLGCWLRGGRLDLIGPALLGFGLAGLHAAGALHGQLPSALEGGEVELSGRVLELPQVETRRTRFLFLVEDAAQNTAAATALRGKRLRLAWYDDYGSTTPGPRLRLHAGERWRLRVKLRAPRGLRNPGGFDSERHALAQRIAAMGYVRDPELARRLAHGRGIDAWRDRMSRRIASAVPKPSSRFVRALALGDTGGLADADWNVLRANGLTHLIAISGFHVGLAAGFFALFARGLWWLWPTLGRRWPRTQAAGLAAACGGLVYAAVAGFALPTVRTLLMIVIVVAARLWRRQQPAADALALAAIAVLLVDPLAPLGAGFWLSFAGVAWLLWCLPQGRQHPLREFLGAQGVATLGLLPLTVVLFGQASLAGPFANLVAVPWWSLVVVPLALLGTAAESLHTGAGPALWSLSATAFDASWPLFERLAASPFALWWLPEARWFALPLALAGAFWLLLPRGVPGKPLALLLWLPLLWPARGLPEPGEVEVTMLDVGQGLSVLVRTHRHALLYDMGPKVEEGFDAGERVVVPALRALGVRQLDVAMVSHGDNDHAGGLEAVAAAFPSARLFGAPGDPLPETRDCIAGREWRWDGVRIRVLHPGLHFPYLKNDSSCVLRLESAHGAVLLTGDIGEVVERNLLREQPGAIRTRIVTVAHHGSRSSSDPGFVEATGAAVALVSAGHGNRFRHPAGDVVERWQAAGAQVPISAETGAVRIRLGQGGLGVDLRRTSHPRLWDAVRRAAREGAPSIEE